MPTSLAARPRAERAPATVSLICGAIAVAATIVPVAGALGVRGWDPSTLVRMGDTEPISTLARRVHPDFKFVHPDAHYDGVYFYAVALDPLARGEAHTLIDKAAYRYGHAGYGWMAGLLSFGNEGAVPAALMLLAIAGMGIAAWATSMLCAALGWTAWGGLGVALNPGLIYAATAVTSEPVGAAFLLLGLLHWVRERHVAGAALLAVACFVKEPFVLAPVGLILWEAISMARARLAAQPTLASGAPGLLGIPGLDGARVRRIGMLCIGPGLFALWYLYLHSTFGTWPHEETHGFLTFPFWGWIETIRLGSLMATGTYLGSQIGAAAGPLLAAFGGLVILGLVLAVRLRSPVDPIYLLIALLISTLGPLGMLYAKDMIRETALPLMLLPAVVAGWRATATSEP
ncbi:MAG: hypothetical protein M3277_10690 [Actinomycetota bacterium]|nr:hypothetical protein [Actinomycetota bacterium]